MNRDFAISRPPVRHSSLPCGLSLRILLDLARQRALACALVLLAGMNVLAQPDNDDFANRQAIQGIDSAFNLSLLNVTREPNEPIEEGFQGGSAWYSWSAPADGAIRIYLESPNPLAGPALALYAGDSLSTLAKVPPSWSGSSLTWVVQSGVHYAIATGTTTPRSGPDDVAWQLHLQFTSRPPNDRFDTPQTISGDQVNLQGWLAAASPEPGAPGTDPNQPTAMLWYRWIAPADGSLNLEAVEGFSATVSVFEGAQKSSLNLLGSLTHPNFPFSTPVRAGRTYSLGMSAWPSDPATVRMTFAQYFTLNGITQGANLRQPASLHLHPVGFPSDETFATFAVYANGLGYLAQTNTPVDMDLPAVTAGVYELLGDATATSGKRYALKPTTFTVTLPNDAFVSAYTLTGAPVEFDADIRGATLDPGELAAFDGSAWFRWTAPVSGMANFEPVSGSGVGLGLYEGPSLAALSPVSANRVVAGVRYVIRAGPAAGQGFGRYRLSVIPIPVPNDAFASRLVVPSTNTDFRESVYIGLATAEPGEPGMVDGQGLPSVWYDFSPMSEGTVEFGGTLDGNLLVPYLYPPKAFLGDDVPGLTEVPSLDGFALFKVSPGRLYHFRLQQAFPGNSSDIVQTVLRFRPAPANRSWSSPSTLSGEHNILRVTLDGAATPPSEPATKYGMTPVRSLWWQWTATSQGWFSFRAPETSKDAFAKRPVLDVFEPDGLGGLTPTPVFPLELEARFFPTQPGKTYLLRMSDMAGDGGMGATPIELHFDWSDLEIVTPTQAQAFQLPTLPILSVRGKAAESPEYRVEYREQVGWGGWPWLDDAILVEPRGTGVESGDRSFQSIGLVPGAHTFYACATGPAGEFAYAPPVAFLVRPANDTFSAEEVLTGHKVTVRGSPSAATVETGEPWDVSKLANRSVWYRWTAPANGNVSFTVYSESYIRAFTGDSLQTLVPARGAGATSGSDTFAATRGTTYHIAVGGFQDPPLTSVAASFSLALDQTTTSWITPQAVTNTVGTPITLALSTTELPGDITRFSLVSGKTVLFTTNQPPLSFVWTPAEPGVYSVIGLLETAAGDTITNVARSIKVRAANLAFSQAQPMPEPQGILQADLRAADRDAGSQLASAWFRFTAPTNGYLILRPTNNLLSSITTQISTGSLSNQQAVITTILGSLSQRGWIACPVTNGVVYNIKLAGSPGAQLTPLAYEFATRPANDNFQNAIPLPAPLAKGRTVTLAATAEPGEPSHTSKPATRSVWWTWTAPARGVLYLSPGNIAIYTGDTLPTLQKIPSTGTVWVQPGQTFRLALDETSGAVPDVSWTVRFEPSPDNDMFNDRRLVEGRRVRFDATLSLATTEPGESGPDGYNYGSTVWYTWTAPFTAPTWLSRVPGYAYARMAVFQGASVEALAIVGYGVDPFTFDAVAGQTYQISVDHNGGGPSATALELIQLAPPTNDAFAARETLAGSLATARGWNFATHRDRSEPSHAGLTGGHSVWYRWVAPRSGDVTLTVSGDISATLVGVYTGGNVASLTTVASASGANQATASFPAVAGTEYAIAVDGVNGAAGDFTITLSQTVPTPSPWLSVETAQQDDGILIVVRARDLAQRPVDLEVSADLVHWALLDSVSEGADVHEWRFAPHTQPQPQAPSRFYRLRTR